MLAKLLPAGGFSQVMWSWHLSQKSSSLIDENVIKKWFDSSLQSTDFQSGYVEAPLADEGFQVQEIRVPLRTWSHFKYEMPGLFIQWESVLSDRGVPHPQLPSLCSEWVKRNSCGHIVILCDGKDAMRGRVTSSDDTQSFHNNLRQLAEQVDHPVYALRIAKRSKSSSYSLPPQPGVLALLQAQHLLDLHSENTVYVFTDSDHMKMAQAAGVKYIKMSTALRSSKWVVDGPYITPAVPDMFGSMSVEKPRDDLPTPQPARVPLYEELSEIRHTLHASREYSFGYEEHIFIKSWDSLLRFQEEFSSQVTPVNSSCSNLRKTSRSACVGQSGAQGSKRKTDDTTIVQSAGEAELNIPSWMTKKLRRQPTLSRMSSSEKEDSKESATSYRSSRTVYLMTEKELCTIARQVLSEAGREDVSERHEESKDAN